MWLHGGCYGPRVYLAVIMVRLRVGHRSRTYAWYERGLSDQEVRRLSRLCCLV